MPDIGALPNEAAATTRQDLDGGPLSNLGAAHLIDQRLRRLDELVRRNAKALDRDDHGAPVVRGEVLALSPTGGALKMAEAAGFKIVRRDDIEPLGLEEVALAPPRGQSVRQAVRALRKLDPGGQYDFDHIYSEAASTIAARSPTEGEGDGAGTGATPAVRVGLLDTGVSRQDKIFAGAVVEQRAFAPGGVKIDAHGTAVASLIVGDGGRFHGAAPGARLYAADVYGTGPTGGSADAIVHALAWMAQEGVPVINISLVGPPNLALAAAVKAVTARGERVVAPVGNDGPAAPPLYPASYPEVISVTAVDPRGRVIFEAGRASHVDFAAPGVDMLAEKPGGGLVPVRGASFAAPIVAGRLALLLRTPERGTAARALAALAAAARRPAGGGAAELGHGIIGEDVRLDPHAAR